MNRKNIKIARAKKEPVILLLEKMSAGQMFFHKGQLYSRMAWQKEASEGFVRAFKIVDGTMEEIDSSANVTPINATVNYEYWEPREPPPESCPNEA